MKSARNVVLTTLVASAFLCGLQKASSEQVAVRHPEGEVHGFLVLRSLSGEALASGDLIQVAHGDRVTSQLLFQFKDGSVHDETAVFSQRDHFRLLNYHLIQKGRSFDHPTEITLDGSTGQVIVHTADKNGKQDTYTQRLDIPPDVANGLVPILLKNLPSQATQSTFSMVAAAPKPRLVSLAISRQGEDSFSVAGSSRKAIHYIVKVQIGGVEGLLASLLKKQPPDIQVWILGGAAPVFVKSEGPLFLGGPIWRIELLGPVWP